MKPLLAALALAVALAVPGGGAPPPAAQLVPSPAPTSFRATMRHGNVVEAVSWQLPESWAQRRLTQAAFVGDVVEHAGARFYAASASTPGIVEGRTYPARPDGHSFSSLVLGPTEFVLARARAGALRLRATRVAGRPALRAKVFLRANPCAGLRAGSLDVALDRRTLLPLRVLERRGRRTFRTTFSYSRVGQPLPAREFRPPRLGRRPQRSDDRFVRATPQDAARRLSYTPRLPRTLPRGFVLAVSGWARRTARTGPEGSNPRYRELFAAVYRRGLERIDVTQRLAGRSGWLGDPFGIECEFQFEERARVGSRAARYGIGPSIVPHLYWRDGRLLLTVSGALPKRELVEIARSLAPAPARR